MEINEITPVEKRGKFYFKREDKFEVNGVRGGKARACLQLAEGANGLVCPSSRHSNQISIVSRIGEHLGLKVRAHLPRGKVTPIMQDGLDHGVEIVCHDPGYPSVLRARARQDAEDRGHRLIPWGMESEIQISGTSIQAANIPYNAKRVVVTAACGIALAGVLHGLRKWNLKVPVLGVYVATDPSSYLDKWAPVNWREQVTLEWSGLPYHTLAKQNEICGIKLDSTYEAKCIPFLKPGDCFWIVGIKPIEVNGGY